MEVVPGEPIKSKVRKMMDAWARSQGKAVAQLQAELEAEFADPE
jgi:hypothetical protein